MNYTYYTCWEDLDIPSMTSAQIEIHVNAVVALSSQILEHSNLPGVLILFPLRMAGANAAKPSQRDELVRLLDRISQKGFVVAERIKVDLRELWEYQQRVANSEI